MDDEKVKYFRVPFQSPEHLRDWCVEYLGIEFPMGHIDPDSTSSPAEAMYEAYANFRDDKYAEIPGYIWLSSRDSYKTLCESALAIILMVHFCVPLAHMAAISAQSKKAISYVNMFLRKITPYLKAHGMKIGSDSASKAEIIMPNGEAAYINVIVCTMQGANSEHVPFMSYDELDVIRFPSAYEEAKLIPARFGKYGPLTVKCSTRKFAFGMMEQELDQAKTSGEKILRWNILDVTERCGPERHLPEQPKQIRYIGKDLPLSNISPEEFELLPALSKEKMEPIEAYAGCAKCPLLAVCKTRLAHRPESNVGGLYKPIDLTIRQFRITSPDMGAAQLMCWRPTKSGLVYGRFEDVPDVNSNVITPENAWRTLTGEEPPGHVTGDDVIDLMIKLGIKFKCGVDWGSTHAFAIVVSAQLPNRDWWMVDCHAVPGLEFEQMVALAEQVRDRYPIDKWYCDQSAPMFIKAFKRRKMTCPKFVKDVQGGIESTRAQIIDGLGRRHLKVLKSDKTEYLITCFRKHAFMLDQAGKPTIEPSDDEYADVADSIRYLAQNLYPVSKKKGRTPVQKYPGYSPGLVSPKPPPGEDYIALKVKELTNREVIPGTQRSGGLFWDFSGEDGEDKS